MVAAHGMEAALHVNNASGLTFNHAVREAPPETRSSEGGGVWAEYVPTVALKSTLLLLMTSMCLYRSAWLGGRGDRPGFPIGPSRKKLFGWIVTVSQPPARKRTAEYTFKDPEPARRQGSDNSKK